MAAANKAPPSPTPVVRRMVKDIVAIKKIGSGSFATVYQGYHQHTGVLVAVKGISKEKLSTHKKHQENLDSEVKVMQTLVHPNIVRLIDIHKTDRHVYLIMEYCDQNDLAHLIHKMGPMVRDVARPLLKQLCAGLEFMRQHDMVHRDLKPQNLLLSSGVPRLYAKDQSTPTTLTTPQSLLLKIADFGFARHMQPMSMAATLCGSPLYMAPEILRYEKYDEKADLWSVGVILYEMYCGKTPYTGTNPMDLIKNIEKHPVIYPPFNLKRGPTTCTVPALDLDCFHLLQGLLQRNPQNRFTFQQLFNHPFVSDSSKSTPSTITATTVTTTTTTVTLTASVPVTASTLLDQTVVTLSPKGAVLTKTAKPLTVPRIDCTVLTPRSASTQKPIEMISSLTSLVGNRDNKSPSPSPINLVSPTERKEMVGSKSSASSTTVGGGVSGSGIGFVMVESKQTIKKLPPHLLHKKVLKPRSPPPPSPDAMMKQFSNNMNDVKMIIECADDQRKPIHESVCESVCGTAELAAGKIVLYVHSLTLLMTCVKHMQLCKLQHAAVQDRLTTQIDEAKKCYTVVMNKLLEVQKTVDMNDPQLSSPSVEELLYKWAKQRAINIAVDESLTPAATLATGIIARYQSVILVLEYLLRGSSVDAHDHQIITRDIQRIYQRIHTRFKTP